VEHAPSQLFDAITAFAVPNPNFSSQSRRFFQVWSPNRSPCRADHPIYFGLAILFNQSFRSSTGPKVSCCLIIVNAPFWCNLDPGWPAHWEVQSVETRTLNEPVIKLSLFCTECCTTTVEIISVLQENELNSLTGGTT
jgi:hypothetical protein